MPVRLILLRHGLTAWNLAGRYQGRTDIPLSAAGLADAQEAAAALRHSGAGLIVTSPLQRARATAEVVSRCLGSVPCQIDLRLIELGFGDWEGLTQDEVRRRWPVALREWKRAPQSVRFPGGEALGDGLRRVDDFLRDPPWAGSAVARCVVAVTHTGPIRLAMLRAEGRPLDDYRQLSARPGSVHEFDWDPSGRLRPAGLCSLT